MSELDYPDILLHMRVDDVSDDALEEGIVVVQLQSDVELRLEVGPHAVAHDVLSILPIQQHLFPEHRVAFLSAHIVPQLFRRNVPCLGMVLAHTHLEQILLLVVVHTVLIGELDQEIDVGGRRQVQVQVPTLGHLLQNVVQFAFAQRFLVVNSLPLLCR